MRSLQSLATIPPRF